MSLGRREWMRIAASLALGLAGGLFCSYYIYDTFLTWVPPAMIAVWVGVELQRIRREQRKE
ncbi:hypothetical protein [Isoptericola sp. NPDC057191]|uniref:hypothetical protein n=1 Tax=Isoptericola sp. NPDC057191 TaxID=3346041 RepID=UPI003640FF81